MKAQEFLRKFSTKRDATIATSYMLLYCDPLFKEDILALQKEIESFQDQDLADRVMEHFNQAFGTAYRNNEKVKAIIRNEPKATFDQFASIIQHKKETWWRDPKMQEYLRPATLFGSVNKFKTYLDDATNYWIKKAKQTGHSDTH